MQGVVNRSRRSPRRPIGAMVGAEFTGLVAKELEIRVQGSRFGV